MKRNLLSKHYIYRITNAVNGKKYVGLTIDLNKRRYEHFSQLRRGCHPNHLLQKDFTHYGERSFVFDLIVEVRDLNAAIKEEVKQIGLHDAYNNGYNISGKPKEKLIKKSISAEIDVSLLDKIVEYTSNNKSNRSKWLKDAIYLKALEDGILEEGDFVE